MKLLKITALCVLVVIAFSAGQIYSQYRMKHGYSPSDEQEAYVQIARDYLKEEIKEEVLADATVIESIKVLFGGGLNSGGGAEATVRKDIASVTDASWTPSVEKGANQSR
ncbi:MAG: hypothetical protein GVY36_14345 [Verrucomicrobia bacterium]|jgi:hypothetical protein|nr:hypothetical protein [Verrucomicrobiota bacterium]